MRRLGGITDSMDMNLSKLELVSSPHRAALCAAVHGVTNNLIQLSDCTDLN